MEPILYLIQQLLRGGNGGYYVIPPNGSNGGCGGGAGQTDGSTIGFGGTGSQGYDGWDT